MFFYLWWKSPFNGKPVNRWQRFLYFARCGFIVTMFFGYLLKKFDWILQLICYGLILSTLGIHGLFLATSGLRFTTAALRGFKKHTGPPVPVSTDFVHSDHRNVPDVPALPTNVTFSPPARKPFKAESTVSRPQTRTNKEGPSQNPPVDITSRSPASISVTVGDDFVEDVEDIGNPYLRELPK
ncbi:hypothetical protein BC832DRAFT_390675 [Gaertneriomyces semiglobifer]|nr:hypothetical protein BC832DRAFT_390675 [Gaertneriomyces semiglobifer]